MEAYESGGYLIVPGGANDNSIVDPIWLNRWKDGNGSYDNSLGGGIRTGASGGGGGCNAGAGAALAALLAAIVLRSLRRTK